MGDDLGFSRLNARTWKLDLEAKSAYQRFVDHIVPQMTEPDTSLQDRLGCRGWSAEFIKLGRESFVVEGLDFGGSRAQYDHRPEETTEALIDLINCFIFTLIRKKFRTKISEKLQTDQVRLKEREKNLVHAFQEALHEPFLSEVKGRCKWILGRATVWMAVYAGSFNRAVKSRAWECRGRRVGAFCREVGCLGVQDNPEHDLETLRRLNLYSRVTHRHAVPALARVITIAEILPKVVKILTEEKSVQTDHGPLQDIQDKINTTNVEMRLTRQLLDKFQLSNLRPKIEALDTELVTIAKSFGGDKLLDIEEDVHELVLRVTQSRKDVMKEIRRTQKFVAAASFRELLESIPNTKKSGEYNSTTEQIRDFMGASFESAQKRRQEVTAHPFHNLTGNGTTKEEFQEKSAKLYGILSDEIHNFTARLPTISGNEYTLREEDWNDPEILKILQALSPGTFDGKNAVDWKEERKRYGVIWGKKARGRKGGWKPET